MNPCLIRWPMVTPYGSYDPANSQYAISFKDHDYALHCALWKRFLEQSKPNGWKKATELRLHGSRRSRRLHEARLERTQWPGGLV